MEVADRLIHLAYDAPLHRDGWMPFLEALRIETRSRGASFKWGSYADGSARLLSAGIEEDALRLYGTTFGAMDPFASVKVKPGDDVFGDEMLTRRQVENTDYYQAFGRPYGLRDIHKVVFARSVDNMQVSLALLKEERTNVSARERELTRRLRPHVQRALALSAWATDLKTERSALADALDAAKTPSFLLDDLGRITFASRAAERIVCALDGLRVEQRRLHAVHPDDDRRVQAHLANARFDADPVLVRRPFGQPPHVLLAQPVHNDAARTLVFVRGQSAPQGNTLRLLERLHGLTAAEARVALRIARGQSSREVAATLRISVNTVRAHLRAVFGKTGVTRQAQLASLVARLER